MFNETSISWDVVKAHVGSLPQKQYRYISPSSIGGCHRAHFYKIKGVPVTTPPNIGALVNFQVGFQVERFLMEAYKSQGRLVDWFEDGVCEPFTDDSTGLGGLPDLLVTPTQNPRVVKYSPEGIYQGEAVIVDCKTVNSKWFSYASKYTSLADWVADNKNYVYQQVAYIYLMRKNGYNINRAVLSFFSKDNGYIGKEFEVIWTQELEDKMLKRVNELRGYLDRDELPPCECSGWQIGWCDYGDPLTRTISKTKKEVNTTCCSPILWDNFKKGVQS